MRERSLAPPFSLVASRAFEPLHGFLKLVVAKGLYRADVSSAALRMLHLTLESKAACGAKY